MSVDRWVAEVAPLSGAVPATLSYSIPEDLRSTISAGMAVIVPLRSRWIAGVVIEMSRGGAQAIPASGKPTFTLKPIRSVIDPVPALNAQQLQLARWMADEYCAALGRCCALMVPPGFTPNSAYIYALAESTAKRPPAARNEESLSPRERIISLLDQHGALIESKLKAKLRGVRKWKAALNALVEAGVVLRSSTMERELVSPKRTTLAQLVISDVTLEIVLENLDKQAAGNAKRVTALGRRRAVLEYLQEHNRLAWTDWITAETGANRADLDWLVERDYILLGDAERWRDPLADIDYVVTSPPPLTGDQQRAWQVVEQALTANGNPNADGIPAHNPQFLLRGVTGSGKTEVYMRAVALALQQGRGVLVLVPEISLTPQTARRFLSRFPGKVALIHSRLKMGERFDTWRRIRTGELPVVVGARSALFSPLPQVGVIVLDEEHDQSYKQNAPPYYDARRVAMQYAAACNATLLLGSATPSLEAWHMAQEGTLRVLELPNRVRGHVNRIADQQARLGIRSAAQPETDTVMYQPMPDVQVVDMRAELRAGNTSMFSGALGVALGETLQRGEQAILFLNRRGNASCVICRDCGYAMRCPNDDVPLTYHQVFEDPAKGSGRMAHSMRCHQCDHVESVPAICPSCNSPRIKFVGIGTQKVEQALHEQYPAARVVRWDKDASVALGRTSADQLLKRFVNQQADILVGTQMIAKGLDLPLVTLVGVVLADIGLFLPDFRASERVFGLIEQVAGRAGRSLLTGRVIVQTYNPEHPAVDFASRHDVAGFARYELEQRKILNLPPYVRLVRLEIADEDNAAARLACEMLARALRQRADQPTDVIGPAQAYFARRANRYRWQCLVRTHSPRQLLDGVDLPRGCVVDVDPISVL